MRVCLATAALVGGSAAVTAGTAGYVGYKALTAPPGPGAQREKYRADLRRLKRMGQLTPADERASLAWVATASSEQIARHRRDINATYFTP